MAHGLSCSEACGIFLGQGSNPRPPALAGGFLTTVPPGKPQTLIFICNFFFFFFNFGCFWVFVSVRGLSPVVASGSHSSLPCVGLSLSRPLPLRSTGSRCVGSVLVAHGLSCSVACGIFPDQGSNPCFLHWQADS